MKSYIKKIGTMALALAVANAATSQVRDYARRKNIPVLRDI